ncbi:universal stress protein [Pseudothauera rhizosphaerae]|uniref:Universal stress protein n=1 Tax=Pseudothauera rhizosphaerae TaxID=2565932 RepID=A0A4S4AG14_9RHOO|nr:universal stress protein [Pseudothauera rhizosphaerae]THF57707.1 universal stress protein [Pseudothauera rhizosphaerae]
MASGQPAAVVLGTDLSARCDRPLDRAAQLAGEWNAELVALHVLEGPQEPDLALRWSTDEDAGDADILARRELMRELAGLEVRASLRIARGDVADAIRGAAEESGAGLIVTGMARSEVLGRFLPGSNVERLARMDTPPLLVVRNRVRGPYRRVVVATDFSMPSCRALQQALAFLPGREAELFHSHLSPMGIQPDEAATQSIRQGIERSEYAAFLDACPVPEAAGQSLRLTVTFGPLETTLTRHVRENDVDLVVMGTQGRSGLGGILLGSTAARMLDWLPCDMLIVHR